LLESTLETIKLSLRTFFLFLKVLRYSLWKKSWFFSRDDFPFKT